MSDLVLWRVEPLATPPLSASCPACRRSDRFECAERFRVNAQQARLDVWLLYRCRVCDHTTKRRLLRRTPVATLAPELLEGYLHDDPELVRRHAFELAVAEPLPYRVERPPLPGSAEIAARIVQPWPCGLRWDRFLARELSLSRSKLVAAWQRGDIAVPGVASLARPVADGQEFRAARSEFLKFQARPLSQGARFGISGAW